MCAQVVFNHTATYTVRVNDEFLEHCHDDALSIEVWGHRTLFDTNESAIADVGSNNKTIEERCAHTFLSDRGRTDGLR
jgi:hypothetical protein